MKKRRTIVVYAKAQLLTHILMYHMHLYCTTIESFLPESQHLQTSLNC